MEVNLTWGSGKQYDIHLKVTPSEGAGYLYTSSCGSLVEGCPQSINYLAGLACLTLWPRWPLAGDAGAGSWHALKWKGLGGLSQAPIESTITQIEGT